MRSAPVAGTDRERAGLAVVVGEIERVPLRAAQPSPVKDGEQGEGMRSAGSGAGVGESRYP
jgi:hypothetical protein